MTLTQSDIAEIWCTSLGVPSVTADDDFFDLGGHSLMAMRVVAQVERLADTEVSVNTLLDNPTLAEFHAAVARVVAPA